MQANNTRLCNIARTAGIEINVTKTRSMQINASQEAPLTADGQAIKEVDRFTYLGSIVSKTGRMRILRLGSTKYIKLLPL